MSTSGAVAADATFSTDPTVLLQQASVWLQDGKLEQAEEALRRVLALDPTSADAINLLLVADSVLEVVETTASSGVAHGGYKITAKVSRT